jgi:hypothetical protein
MKVEVVVGDPGSAGDLIRMLLEQFDGESICFDAERGRVCFEHGERDADLARVLRVAEAWVNLYNRPPADVEIDGRCYLLAPSVPVGGGL